MYACALLTTIAPSHGQFHSKRQTHIKETKIHRTTRNHTPHTPHSITSLIPISPFRPILYQEVGEKVLQDTFEYTSCRNKKTVTAMDVVHAFERNGIKLYGDAYASAPGT
jgi:histone H3/H4